VRRALPVIFLIFIVSSLWGQYHSTLNYTPKEGLISAELYTVFVDSKGRVWAGSGSGLSCFDGVAFQNYTIEEGLWNNRIKEIFEDDQGNIWIQHEVPDEANMKASFIKGNGKVEVVEVTKYTGWSNGGLFWNKFSGEVYFLF